MPRVGYRFGNLSISLAGGASFMYAQQEFNGEREKGSDTIGQPTDKKTAINDSHIHVGWKIAPGIDYRITERLSLFGQFHYANYGSATYKLADQYTNAGTFRSGDLKVVGGRVGILLAF